MDLKRDILEIVEINSGGVKYVKLLVALLERGHAADPVAIDKAVASLPQLGTLDYVRVLGGEPIGAKQFIYWRSDL